MSIKPETTKDGIKLRDTKTGKLAGAVSTEGKINVPTPAEDIKRLESEMSDAQSMAWESNQPEAYDDFNKKRELFENVLTANALLIVETLEENDKANLRLAHFNEKGERQSDVYINDGALDADTIAELKQDGTFQNEGHTFKVLSIEKTGRATEEELAAWDAEETKAKKGAELVEKIIKESHTFTKEEKEIVAKALVALGQTPNIQKYLDIIDILTNDDYESVLPGLGEHLPDGDGAPDEEKSPLAAAMYYGLAKQLEDELPGKAVELLQGPFLLVRPDFQA